MRAMLIVVTSFCLLGCQDLAETFNPDAEGRKPVSPPGILPVDQMGGVDAAAGGGAKPVGAADAAVDEDGLADAAAEADETSRRESIVGKTTARIVDLKQATAENPKLVVVENRVRGNDPFSVAASAYIMASSRVTALNFKHQMNLTKELEGRYPTYEEFTDSARKMGMHFAMLPPYQMYAYDDKNGDLVILEDKEDKARRYKAAGIPLED